MSFTYETESDNKLPFLDILQTRRLRLIFIENGLYTNFHSLLPENYKIRLVLTLLYIIYTVYSDWSKIHAEIIKLRTIILKNNYPSSFTNYPSSFTDRCINLFFNRLFLAQKIAVPMVLRKVISLSIPLMGIDSLKIRCKLIGLVKTYFPFCKIQVIFNSENRSGSFFQFKDKLQLNARSLILDQIYVYQLQFCLYTMS